MTRNRLGARLAELARQSDDLAGFTTAADDLLRRAIGYDIAIWGAIDPLTLMFTSCVPIWAPGAEVAGGEGFDEQREMRLFELEFHTHEPNVYPGLALQPCPAAALRETVPQPGGAVRRYDELLEPAGIFDELRLVLRDRDTSWGVLTAYRMGPGDQFSRADVDSAAAVSSILSHGYRNAMLVAALESATLATPPGLLTVTRDGAVRSTSAAAEELLGGLAAGRIARIVRQLIAAAERSGHVTATAAGKGGPVSLQLMVMKDSPDEYGIIVERPRPRELAELIMRGLGLTGRERVVAALVASGRTTGQIARKLAISPHTVNDHLKAIYRKAGVATRNELTAFLYATYYLPPRKSGATPSPYGYFLADS